MTVNPEVDEGSAEEITLERHFSRVEVKIPVSVLTREAPSSHSSVLSTTDVSPSGLFVRTSSPLPKNSKVYVRYILPSRKRGFSKGKVVRVQKSGMAIQFDNASTAINEELY